MSSRLAAFIAAALWGFTYVVSTTLLPDNPVFLGTVRALGGGIVLLLVARQLPPPEFLPKLIGLGTLNCGLFFLFLFIGALRLPGGIAATFQTMGPLFTVLLAWPLLMQKPTAIKLISILIGVVGVVLIVFKGQVGLDPIGVLAALGSALSLALGGVLLNRWGRPPELSHIAFTGWQLLIGGFELMIIDLIIEDIPSTLTGVNALGLVILAVGLTAIPFTLWFRAIGTIGAAAVAPFNLVIPVVALILGVVFSGFIPGPIQFVGVGLVIIGLVVNQWASRADRAPVVNPTPEPAAAP